MIILLIFLSFWLGLAFRSAIIALLITAVVFLLFVLKRFKLKICLLCAFSLFIGICFSCSRIFSPKEQYQGVVYQAKENYFLFNSGGERLYVYSKGHHYDIGDWLSIKGEKEDLSFTTIESSFDFKSYLNKRGVYNSLKSQTIKVDFTNPIRINERRKKLLNNFNAEEKSVIGAMLFSDGADDEISDNIRDLHLARFLAASGIFISAFHRFFTRLFSRFMKDKWAEIVSLSFLSLYTIFTFPRFTVIKVMLFLIIRWINEYPLKKKFSYLTLLSSFGIFCLLCNHYLAVQDSFILGFMIPLISYLGRHIYQGHKIKKWLFHYLLIYMFFMPI